MKERNKRVPDVIFMGVFLLSSLGWNADIGTARAAVADHLVINEVQIESAVTVEDDWVELYNPTSQAIELAGWSIQKSAGSGGSVVRQALSGSVPPQGYFLIVRNGSSTAQALKDAADLLISDSFSPADNNIIYLTDNNLNVTPTTALDSHVIDYVGFGTAGYSETAPAANPTKGKSIARMPDGEDTDNNSLDFFLQDTPTPQNSGGQTENNISGTVLLTITPDAVPAHNITSTGADIVFRLNTAGSAKVNYGLTQAYGEATVSATALENTDATISLTGLTCGSTYHYSVYAENLTTAETDMTADATFTTLPCGITLNSLTMTKQTAKANNAYVDGWQWTFDLTVWNTAETSLKMKFDPWSGAGTLSAGANMQFSADNGSSWLDIANDSAYPASGVDISGIDNSASAGRQVNILVRMKVPSGTKAGSYYSNYGILTE